MMLSTKRNMRFINTKTFFILLLFAITSSILQAQEIIKDTVVPKKTVKSGGQRTKIDGIVAVVGDYIILDSDIDKSFLEISSQGNSIEGITRCQMLGKLLEDKLYAHQAIQDSIKVTDEEVKAKMDEQIAFMLEQLGSMDKAVKYFKKANEADFRADLFEIIKTNKLTSEMQRSIIDKVEITPEEVHQFFDRIPKDELPVFGAEVEVAQIIIKPKITDAERQKAIDRLLEIRADVLAGASFSTKAVLYSQDPGSSSNGGYYKMTKKTPFVKEFKEVAFSLNQGDISEPFETDFGFHIIYVEKIKGQEIEIRHILIVPEISKESLIEAKEKITLIRENIVSGKITFAEAARTESDEKETKTNGGILVNPKTQDTHFELTKMDPALYSQISNLKAGEVSYPILDSEPSGKKKYKLLTITKKIPEHTADYAIDYTKIKDLALKEKQIKAIEKWSNEKIKETYIKINGEYRNCDFTNNWLKK